MVVVAVFVVVVFLVDVFVVFAVVVFFVALTQNFRNELTLHMKIKKVNKTGLKKYHLLKRKFLKEKYAGNDCSLNNRWARIAQSVVPPAVLFSFSIKDNPPGSLGEEPQ